VGAHVDAATRFLGGLLGDCSGRGNLFRTHEIAVQIVVRLEVVQVEVRGGKDDLRVEQAADMFSDGDVARQKSERVGVACGFDPPLSHRTHQALARGKACVATVLGDDETLVKVALVVARQDRDQRIDRRPGLDS